MTCNLLSWNKSAILLFMFSSTNIQIFLAVFAMSLATVGLHVRTLKKLPVSKKMLNKNLVANLLPKHLR